MRSALAGLGCALALALAGCGGDAPFNPPPPAQGDSDPAATQAGWRTVANRRVGFTVSVPRGWTVRKRRTATLVRSDDALVAVSLAADRGRRGRTLAAADYARRVLVALPGFEGLRPSAPRPVPGSPYRSALVEGEGTATRRRQRQRVTVVAYRVPDAVTYTAVAFRPAASASAYDGALRTLLASLRALPPDR